MRIVIGILALWVFGLGGYLLYEEYWPGATGDLVVLSTPPDAEIWVDLVVSGSTTGSDPISLKRGRHSVIVKHNGVQGDPFVQVVTIRPGHTETLNFTFPGLADSILDKPEEIADSKPAAPEKKTSASDSKPSEEKKHAVPPRVTPIKERVQEEMPWDVPRSGPQSVDTKDFIPEEAAAKAPEETTPKPTASRADTTARRPRPGKIRGSVEISSSVPGATIFLNDRPQKEKTPATLTMEAGTYTIRAELEGYQSTPDEHAVRISRAASAQFVFFTLIEERKARREITIRTEPVEGEIFVDDVSVGPGEAVFPHEFGVFQIRYGDVEGYLTPEPVRLTVTPSDANPVVTGRYSKKMHFTAYCEAENRVVTEGEISYEVGVFYKTGGPRVNTTHGPRVRQIPASQKFGWELAMGDANRNPTGSDYIEFIFDLPNGVPASTPLNLMIYLYRTTRKYPLTLSGRSEVTVTVNGRIFLDNYRPKHGQDGIELDRFEEWSLQHTLVPGENRIMIRSGKNNSTFNYLWKVVIE